MRVMPTRILGLGHWWVLLGSVIPNGASLKVLAPTATLGELAAPPPLGSEPQSSRTNSPSLICLGG
jgi:hypothetical protein